MLLLWLLAAGVALAWSHEAPKFISGVSGARFSGDVIREVAQGDLRFAGTAPDGLKTRGGAACERWIVVTTIFPPSPATRLLGEMTQQGWCFVVVADTNGPAEYEGVKGVVYLTVDWQERLHFHIMDHLPWRHFGRKNVGFLYAIAHGAKVIYDTDDDNRLKAKHIPVAGLHAQGGRLMHSPLNASWPLVPPGPPWVLNPYLAFRPTCGHIWPRGFLLDHVRDRGAENMSLSVVQLEQPPSVQQFLADEDPDVDAVFRLTRQLPCFFEGPQSGAQDVYAVPPEVFVPYNAQATVHLYDAFWGLLLPVTVHGRVSDIWRAYLTQRLLWDVGQVVAFHPAHVVHDRVMHDYLKDFHSEQDIYLKASALVAFLAEWTSSATTLVERLEQLWAALYSRGFVELGDLKLAQAWIRDLLSVGYNFPEIRHFSIGVGGKAEL